jgi:PAS domain S-box-containing protein
MVDHQGAIELVNEECERMFGYKRTELVGASIDLLVPEHGRDRHLANRAFFASNAAKRQMGVGRDLRALRRNGSEFPVEIGLTPIRRNQGLAVLAVVVDITERRQAEKVIDEKMMQLEQANANLAQFAFVASHDIQEPLRKIIAFSDILRTAIADNNSEDMELAARVMSKSALQARDFVRDMLGLARTMNTALEFEEIAFAEVVATVLQNLSLAISDLGAHVESQVEPLLVQADRAQATQLVQNIVENALKYRRKDRAPRIEIATQSVSGKLTRLSIKDNGIGFPAHRRDEIFEPFRRLHTRDVYAGSGLGLAICKAIANRHGWRMRADSAPGEGSRFEIIFSESDTQ